MTRCIVVGCTSGYDSNNEKVHFFRVPKDEKIRNMWQAALRRRDFIIKSSQAVCEKHFLHTDIVWNREICDEKGNVLGVSASFKVPRLRKGTVPSQFPWTEISIDTKNKSQNENTNWEEILDFEKLYEKNNEKNIHVLISFDNIINMVNKKQLHMPKHWTYTQCYNNDVRLLVFFLPICQKFENNNDGYTFNCLKEIFLEEDMTLQINILKQPILNVPSNISIMPIIKTIESKEQLEELLFSINNVNICPGVDNLTNKIEELEYSEVYKDVCGTWRHKKCLLLVLFSSQKCNFCSIVRKSLNQKRRRINIMKLAENKRIKLNLPTAIKQKKLLLLRKKYYKAEKAKKRAKYVGNKLKTELMNCMIKTKEVSTINIQDQLKEKQVPQNQLVAIQEMIEAAKHKDSKGHRYNDKWILLCMLIHMKSPTTYNFLRDNQILPLPCVRTIRRYLSLIDTPCGFDLKFFEMFKLALQKKNEKQKHGVILLDEIHLRECIGINSKTLTYTGLIDFGIDGMQSLNLDEKADYGLVIMFQPLADFYSQPIGVFASRGPVLGEVLAQLVIKAIALLESINVKVHGVITDGAATNRKFWTTVGICGRKDNLVNYFDHPTVNDRRVYVFSDTPHLIKTIRNRLYNTPLQLSLDEKPVKWDYFRFLHDKDKTLPAQMRICPKITINHIILTNAAKMRVKLATQIFSKSMAHGLRFYKNFLSELQDCDSTANFCEWINNLFDALNRNKSSGGVAIDDTDYKILEKSLDILNAWEQQVDNGTILQTNFLTKQTAVGLRVTIKSTLDLIQYLTKNAGFSSILTGRLNQDSLERFFGSIRQAAGSNDHPGTPTFLQLYKILSTFAILKSPSYGNCSVEKYEPLISISDIKHLYTQSNNTSLLKLKEKLDHVINQDQWSFNDLQDHDYCQPEIADCIIYYTTGYLCNYILKRIKCNICKTAFINAENSETYSSFPNVIPVNTKNKLFVHPNVKMFNFIKYLEKLFSKYCHRTDVYNAILDDIYINHCIFSCKEHNDILLAQIIDFYICMRMRQYSNKINSEEKKINQNVKKSAKYYTS